MARVFGEIEGVTVGRVFPDRRALSASGVHRPTQAGISGAGAEGADSIVVSGGYEDDMDLGDEVIYTGHGGNDPNTGRQVANQELTRGNLALAYNRTAGLPVRVVRGAQLESPFAPAGGYRYDGLYAVEDVWHDVGRTGFRVWRYRLRRLDGPPANQTGSATLPAAPAERRPTMTLRLIRDSARTRRVKEWHDYHCQVCGVRLESAAGPYAEGAHIRPLGAPHDGPDSEDNILCLCPNHHALFDLGGFTVNENYTLKGVPGSLRTATAHRVSVDYLAYHREHYEE